MLATNIISLKVVSVWDCSIEGIVENILIENKKHKLRYLKVYNEETDATFLLSYKDIYKLSKNVVLIKNSQVLNPASNLELCEYDCLNPIGATLLDFNGKSFGQIKDFDISDNFSMQTLILDNLTISIKDIISLGEKIVLMKSPNNVKISSFSPKKKIKKISEDYKVTLLAEVNQTPIEKPLKSPEEFSPAPSVSPTSPKRLVTDSRFLLNRKLTENIMLGNGEILFKKDTKITYQVIDKARTFGKLFELTQKSKN